MSRNLRANRRRRNSSSNPRNTQNVQKASGVIAPRVKQVGGEKFAIVCVDPAKHRSEWMMADYFGNLLIEPQTLEHRRGKRNVRSNAGRKPLVCQRWMHAPLWSQGEIRQNARLLRLLRVSFDERSRPKLVVLAGFFNSPRRRRTQNELLMWIPSRLC